MATNLDRFCHEEYIRAGDTARPDVADALRHELVELDKAAARWDRQMERGVISDGEWDANRRRIREERAGVELEIARLADTEKRAAAAPSYEEWQRMADNLDDATLRAFLLRAVERIVVGDGGALTVVRR